jgi:protein-L-isoaspartate(D-aspartate) O-methyltransferase
MQGVGKNHSRSISLHGGEVNLWVGEQQVDATALSEVFSTARVEAWSGITLRKGEIFGDLDLWLAGLPDFCLLSAKQEAVDRGVVSPDWLVGTPALIGRGSSLAYQPKLRPVNPDKTIKELGVYAHGPRAAELADRFVEQIQIWDRDHRHGPGPRLAVHPAGTPDADLPAGLVMAAGRACRGDRGRQSGVGPPRRGRVRWTGSSVVSAAASSGVGDPVSAADDEPGHSIRAFRGGGSVAHRLRSRRPLG